MKNHPHVMSIIKTTLRANTALVFFIVLICLIGAVLPAFTPLIYADIIDVFIPKQDSVRMLVYVGLLILIPVLTSLVFNLRNVLSFRLCDAVTRKMRMALMKKAIHMPIADYDAWGENTIAYRITRSCGQVGEVFLSETILSLIGAVLSLLSVLIPMFILNWKMALISLVSMPVLYLVMRVIRKKVLERDQKLFDTLMAGEEDIHETLAGMREIRLFGGEERVCRRFDEWLRRHTKSKTESVTVHEFDRVTLPELCLQTLYGLILVLGAVFVARDTITIGVLVAFIAYVPRSFAGIKELLGIQVNLKSVEPAMQSIEEILAARDADNGTVRALPADRTLCYRGVSFSYKDNSFAVKNVSFEAHKGEAVAIVGETGGGKSTLLQLLLRLYQPTEGEITLGGNSVKDYDLDEYRKKFAVVSQSGYLWASSVADNVAWPDTSIDEEAFWDAMQRAQLTHFVEALPDREQTMLGERGQSVSGGERQRLSFAHALYQDREFLVLDEPTAALDANTAEAITAEILKLKGTKTIITVTHQLSSILAYDKVLVVKDGVVVEAGTSAELWERGGVFREMCEKQGIQL